MEINTRCCEGRTYWGLVKEPELTFVGATDQVLRALDMVCVDYHPHSTTNLAPLVQQGPHLFAA